MDSQNAKSAGQSPEATRSEVPESEAVASGAPALVSKLTAQLSPLAEKALWATAATLRKGARHLDANARTVADLAARLTPSTVPTGPTEG